MSGGSLNYFYAALEEHSGDFNDRELDDLVKNLADLFHAREWYLSGDTCEGDWREARNNFKKKWFTERGHQKRIERYLSEICAEVRESFGMTKDYCKNCKHWTKKPDSERYGRCDFEEHCLMHRSEKCEKYESREEGGENGTDPFV